MGAALGGESITPYAAALRDPPVLRTARLLLRQPAERDIPAIIAIAGDWEVARRLSRMPHPYHEEHARFFIDEVARGELTWAIADRASDVMIGAIGLTSPDSDGTVELGYYLARDRWGAGLATEAGAAVVAHGAGLVGRARLRSGYHANNPASGRVLAKLGFVKIGTGERFCLTTGKVEASVEVGLPG